MTLKNKYKSVAMNFELDENKSKSEAVLSTFKLKLLKCLEQDYESDPLLIKNIENSKFGLFDLLELRNMGNEFCNLIHLINTDDNDSNKNIIKNKQEQISIAFEMSTIIFGKILDILINIYKRSNNSKGIFIKLNSQTISDLYKIQSLFDGLPIDIQSYIKEKFILYKEGIDQYNMGLISLEWINSIVNNFEIFQKKNPKNIIKELFGFNAKYKVDMKTTPYGIVLYLNQIDFAISKLVQLYDPATLDPKEIRQILKQKHFSKTILTDNIYLLDYPGQFIFIVNKSHKGFDIKHDPKKLILEDILDWQTQKCEGDFYEYPTKDLDITFKDVLDQTGLESENSRSMIIDLLIKFFTNQLEKNLEINKKLIIQKSEKNYNDQNLEKEFIDIESDNPFIHNPIYLGRQIIRYCKRVNMPIQMKDIINDNLIALLSLYNKITKNICLLASNNNKSLKKLKNSPLKNWHKYDNKFNSKSFSMNSEANLDEIEEYFNRLVKLKAIH